MIRASFRDVPQLKVKASFRCALGLGVELDLRLWLG
jgi:hypothetical protein